MLWNVSRVTLKDCIITICRDKERDMAVCPNCELCPYFGEGMGEGWTVFQQMSVSFIAFNGIGKTKEEKFDIGNMDSGALSEYYYEYAEVYLYFL